MDKDHRTHGSNAGRPCRGNRSSADQCPYGNSNDLNEYDLELRRASETTRCSCNCLQFVSLKQRRRTRGLTSRRNVMSLIVIRWIVVTAFIASVVLLTALLYKQKNGLQNFDTRAVGMGTHSRKPTFDNVTIAASDVSSDKILATAATTTSRKKTVRISPKRKKKSSLGFPFNPETFDNSTVGKKKYVIIYWSKIRGFRPRIQTKKEYEHDPHVWPYTYAGDNCPVNCELTNDRSRAAEASAFVVHSRLTDVWDLPPYKYLAPWILQNNENPVYTPALSNRRLMSKFNLLISYRLDSDFPSPIYPKPSLDPPIPFNKRLGNVLAVFSKCEPVRTEYMRQLMKYIDVHSYGACLKNKKGLIGLYSQINGKYVFKDYKFVMSRYYKFSLVFMNQDCDHFVDDRLYHALETGSVPIYMGTDLIDQFLPGNLRNSIIRASDFSGPKELASYLQYLSNNETAFNRYLEWKWQGLGDYKNTTIGRWWDIKYPLFCQVCMRLSQGNLHSGLDVDRCEPRRYQHWGLEPPYPKTYPRKKIEPEISEQFFMYWKPLLVTGIVFASIVLIMNCCVQCMIHGGYEEKVPL
ncbi:alpha-(1,3)-fucosyltransferase 11-like [Rhopilema esculentum]|uniref:alpha-(1,3)-fucosyltransferase 11-like n=1 Tax=Rhopilema esculentum TaxID=499914 RepID=UPI0031CFD88F|eukprot:gene9354-17057_t